MSAAGLGSWPSGWISSSDNSGVIHNHRFVKLKGGRFQLCECALGERCIGVVNDGSKLPPMDANEATINVTESAGQSVPGVIPPGQVALVEVGVGGLTLNDLVTSDETGRAINSVGGYADQGDVVNGIALHDALEGELAYILVWPQVL